MTARRLLLASVTLLALAGSAHAQDPGRLDRLEKQVRELRAIVFQGRDTGQPVEVKLAGPDPAVSSLEQRMDDVTNQLRQISGQLEVMTHDADEARHAAQSVRDQNGELRGRLQDLSDRVARLEAQLAPGAAAGGSQIPPPPVDNSIPPPPSASGGAGPQPTDATAAAQSADTGRLGGPSSAPGAAPPPEAAAPPAAPTAADLYRAARGKVTSGDYAGASSAFQDYVTRYPTAKNLSEAYYWMGESDYAREDFQDATPAYARALKGWPKSPWAGDATVKLARALAETNRAPEACAALTEFDHRYGGAASPTTKARAEAVRKRAQCGG